MRNVYEKHSFFWFLDYLWNAGYLWLPRHPILQKCCFFIWISGKFCFVKLVITITIFLFYSDVSPAVDRNNLRQHQLQYKTVVMPDSCSVCEKRIRFGKSALRCKDCKSFCHPECKSSLPLPCVPLPCTPNGRKNMGSIGDYTPPCAPMVPALMVHCINEIEQRGLNEIGLYRIPGSEKDVKSKLRTGFSITSSIYSFLRLERKIPSWTRTS